MDHIFILSQDEAAAISDLVDLAHRGRAGFVYEVLDGAVPAYEVDAADETWARVERLSTKLKHQVTHRSHSLDAAMRAALEAIEESAEGVWEHFTCSEVERIANLCRAAGRERVARAILADHIDGDVPGDRHVDGCEACGAGPVEACSPGCGWLPGH